MGFNSIEHDNAVNNNLCNVISIEFKYEIVKNIPNIAHPYLFPWRNVCRYITVLSGC